MLCRQSDAARLAVGVLMIMGRLILPITFTHRSIRYAARHFDSPLSHGGPITAVSGPLSAIMRLFLSSFGYQSSMGATVDTQLRP